MTRTTVAPTSRQRYLYTSFTERTFPHHGALRNAHGLIVWICEHNHGRRAALQCASEHRATLEVQEKGAAPSDVLRKAGSNLEAPANREPDYLAHLPPSVRGFTIGTGAFEAPRRVRP